MESYIESIELTREQLLTMKVIDLKNILLSKGIVKTARAKADLVQLIYSEGLVPSVHIDTRKCQMVKSTLTQCTDYPLSNSIYCSKCSSTKVPRCITSGCRRMVSNESSNKCSKCEQIALNTNQLYEGCTVTTDDIYQFSVLHIAPKLKERKDTTISTYYIDNNGNTCINVGGKHYIFNVKRYEVVNSTSGKLTLDDVDHLREYKMYNIDMSNVIV